MTALNASSQPDRQPFIWGPYNRIARKLFMDLNFERYYVRLHHARASGRQILIEQLFSWSMTRNGQARSSHSTISLETSTLFSVWLRRSPQRYALASPEHDKTN